MISPLTPRQIELGRHALGLPNVNGKSYRNNFVANVGHTDYDDWYRMAQQGYAVRRDGGSLPLSDMDLFHLTPAGARLCLFGRETLDPDDFKSAIAITVGETA